MAHLNEKSFEQIYMGLSTDDRIELRSKLALRCKVAPETVRSWGYGNRTPQTRLVVEKVASYLKSSPAVLFPKF